MEGLWPEDCPPALDTIIVRPKDTRLVHATQRPLWPPPVACASSLFKLSPTWQASEGSAELPQQLKGVAAVGADHLFGRLAAPGTRHELLRRRRLRARLGDRTGLRGGGGVGGGRARRRWRRGWLGGSRRG